MNEQVRKVLWTRNGVRATVVTAGHCTHAQLTSGPAGMLWLAVTAVAVHTSVCRLHTPVCNLHTPVCSLHAGCMQDAYDRMRACRLHAACSIHASVV